MKKVTEKENKVKKPTPTTIHLILTKEFCKRCLKYNNGICPDTGKIFTSKFCNI